MYVGISDRGKAKLARSSSVSSNESPSHAPNEVNKQPVKPASENKPNQSTQPKQEVPTANFFETLDWDRPATEQTKEVKMPTEDESNLLENTSDDEDDFASLRMGGVNGKSDNGNVQSNEQNNDFKPFEANFQDVPGTKSEPEVDFFNNTDNLASDVDLMHIEKTPSNVDILSGTADSSSADFDIMGGNTNSDTFDLFQAFSSNTKSQEPPPVTVTAPKNEFHAFDPFGGSNGMTGSEDNGMGKSSSFSTNPAAASSSGDLMGDWNSFVSTNSSPNISRNNSSSNLGAGGNIPYSGSGTFQQMGGAQMGGANIPRNNSGTFQGLQMGGNIPRNNSGSFQTKGGMGQGSGPAGTGATGKPADPFAEFGKFFALKE